VFRAPTMFQHGFFILLLLLSWDWSTVAAKNADGDSEEHVENNGDTEKKCGGNDESGDKKCSARKETHEKLGKLSREEEEAILNNIGWSKYISKGGTREEDPFDVRLLSQKVLRYGGTPQNFKTEGMPVIFGWRAGFEEGAALPTVIPDPKGIWIDEYGKSIKYSSTPQR